jgi:hypothetical protein
MRAGFWRKCRVCFRWCRISLWLVVLVALGALLWFNRIGLPVFLKTRLLATLHERGVDLEFSRLRLRFGRGLVADNVRLGLAGTTNSPTLSLAETRLQLDFRALLHRRLQVDGLVLRQGRLNWPVSPTNDLHLDHLQARMRFQTNDTWTLDSLQADFADAKLTLTGNIRHAPELRHWKMFQGGSATNRAGWQAQMQKISTTLDQIHFTGEPQLTLAVDGDARDVHSFSVRLTASAPGAQTPWFAAHDIEFSAGLTATTDAPADFDPAWGFWTNLQPYQFSWTARLAQFHSEKLDAASVAAGGFWRAPELAVTNLAVELDGGRLDVSAWLNVATRKLVFTNASNFKLAAIAALLPPSVRGRLADFSWHEPPQLQAGGSLILPAWTNSRPDWNEAVRTTAQLNGQIALTNGTVLGAKIDSVHTHFLYADQIWQVPDFSIAQAKTRLEISASVSAATQNFRGRVRGLLEPEVARSFLATSNAADGFDLVKLAEPLALDLTVSGRGKEYDRLAVEGQLALTNFTVRGQQFGALTTTVNYANRVLELLQPAARIGNGHAKADSITLDFNTQLIYFTNILSEADPEPVVRAIGPKTWELVEPYHYLQPPTVRVNGQIPLADLHGGPEMTQVDMWFDIIKGAPFEWLKLKTTNIVGRLHWRGQTLLLTNAVAAFYGGTARGFADFDFSVPHPGGDYQFMLDVTNANLHRLAADLSSPTNSLAGILAGHVVVTNASTEDLESWKGYGSANLHDGLLWNIPIVRILSPVLNTISPGLGNSRATEASATFIITNGTLFTSNLDIRSTLTRLEYVGTINLQQNVNARVTAHLLRDTWVIGPLVSTALWPVSKLFEYRVTGSLENPKSEPLYVLPKLLLLPLHPIRTLEDFIPGVNSATKTPPEK